MRARAIALLPVFLAAGCAAMSGSQRAVEMRFYETPANEPKRERLKERFTLNASVIAGTTLQHDRASELLNAAQGPAGGDPRKLMQAGRTLAPGEGVVLLGTARAHGASSGATASLEVYQVALACAPADLDAPGDLKDCKGYLMRVTRQWPGEVYEIEQATVALIPEGGTARGRLRAQSAPGGFGAEIEGEFTASVVQLQAADRTVSR